MLRSAALTSGPASVFCAADSVEIGGFAATTKSFRESVQKASHQCERVDLFQALHGGTVAAVRAGAARWKNERPRDRSSLVELAREENGRV